LKENQESFKELKQNDALKLQAIMAKIKQQNCRGKNNSKDKRQQEDQKELSCAAASVPMARFPSENSRFQNFLISTIGLMFSYRYVASVHFLTSNSALLRCAAHTAIYIQITGINQ